ncbi:MAG: four helix bundle protein [Bacteroidetes bacterium]|nr:four helix bundle protein [Bacteroidota bacterium]
MAKYVFQLTDKFPNSEVIGLARQMRRAAVRTFSNISEGFGRAGRLEISGASMFEFKGQILFTYEVGLLSDAVLNIQLNQISAWLEEVNKLIKSLSD